MPQCHLRCDTCKSQVVANTLGECFDKFKCSSDGGPIDDTCRLALRVNGQPVYSIHQEIENNYTGKPTKISGELREASMNRSKKKK